MRSSRSRLRWSWVVLSMPPLYDRGRAPTIPGFWDGHRACSGLTMPLASSPCQTNGDSSRGGTAMSSPSIPTNVPWQMTAAQTMPSEVFEAWYASGRPTGVPEVVLESLPDGGLPPWDTGRPQPAIVGLADAGLITGRVLDVGCGTGDNALFLSERGSSVTGVDSAPSALAAARAKARARGLKVSFVLLDALELARLAERFETAIDSGLLHVFSDEDRARLISGVHAVLVPGGSYHLLCFNEYSTLPGPRRLSQADIRASFARGWVVQAIAPARFAIRGNAPGGDAWLAHIRRI